MSDPQTTKEYHLIIGQPLADALITASQEQEAEVTTMSHLGENPSQAMVDGAYAAAYNEPPEPPADLDADDAADWINGYYA